MSRQEWGGKGQEQNRSKQSIQNRLVKRRNLRLLRCPRASHIQHASAVEADELEQCLGWVGRGGAGKSPISSRSVPLPKQSGQGRPPIRREGQKPCKCESSLFTLRQPPIAPPYTMASLRHMGDYQQQAPEVSIVRTDTCTCTCTCMTWPARVRSSDLGQVGHGNTDMAAAL